LSNQHRNQVKISVSLGNIDPLLILGLNDENLTVIADNFRAQIAARGDRIRISGPEHEVFHIQELFQRLLRIAKKDEPITPDLVRSEIIQVKGIQRFESPPRVQRRDEQKPATGFPEKLSVKHGPSAKRDETETGLSVSTPRKLIQPKTQNQANYLQAIDDYDIVICIGPAGTGKTYLAVAKAVSALTSGKISRIVLTRPAVEAGESLGFLPGNLKEKIDPYLRPLYDALYDMIPMEKLRRLYDEEVLEVAPLAFMRGRTLSDAYVILDEAQNTTPIQMKMFLTRLGWNSKSIVTGDITQIDLGRDQASGLVEARSRLQHIPDIKFIYFDERDVVRPPLVSQIIKAYEDKD
jgi:phosphate starvation-inducible PhoH-like protein